MKPRPPAAAVKGKRKLRTFEVWEQMPSMQAESEEDARANKLPKGRVFVLREVTK